MGHTMFQKTGSSGEERCIQSPDHDLDALLKLAAGGSVHALRNLLEAIRSPLLRYVNGHFDRRISARMGIDDVVQDILLYVTRHLDQLAQPCPIPFQARLKQIAKEHLGLIRRAHVKAARRSVCRESRCLFENEKSNGTSDVGHVDDSQISPQTKCEREEEVHRIRQLLERLPERDKILIQRKFFEGRSTELIARELETSEPAVRMHVIRMIRRIRLLIRERG